MNDDRLSKSSVTNASAIKLLQAASELMGGDAPLAAELGITTSLLAMLLSGRVRVPANVFLRAVDIVDERKPVFSLADLPVANPAGPPDG